MMFSELEKLESELLVLLLLLILLLLICFFLLVCLWLWLRNVLMNYLMIDIMASSSF
jgi:hypothetical protein